VVCIPVCSEQTEQCGVSRDLPAQRERQHTELGILDEGCSFEERRPIRMGGLDEERTGAASADLVVCGR
jgi:hypothetical protein